MLTTPDRWMWGIAICGHEQRDTRAPSAELTPPDPLTRNLQCTAPRGTPPRPCLDDVIALLLRGRGRQGAGV